MYLILGKNYWDGYRNDYMNIDLGLFKSRLIAVNQIHVNRKIDACDWAYEGKELFHNRTSWGRVNATSRLSQTPAQMFHGIFNGLRESYWAGLFTNKDLAEIQSKKYGATVEEDFYCNEDNPTWFLIFDNFDKCAEFVYDELVRTGEL